MATQSEPIRIRDFLGLANPRVLPTDTRLTRDLLNVEIIGGRVLARPGATTLGAVSSAVVNGMLDYDKLGVVKLLRITTSGIDQWSGASWAAITVDTPWSTTATDWPDSVVFKNNLYLLPGPGLKPYTWSGSGSMTLVTAAYTARAIASYSGFLLLGYSNSGPRQINYSADGSTWSAVDVVNMEDAPREVLRMLPFGDSLHVYKSDAIEFLRHVGTSAVTFAQGVISDFIGLGAPLTLKGIRNVGHILMGNDGLLYINTGQIQPVVDKLNYVLEEEIEKDLIDQSWADVYPSRSIYSLFYPLNGATYANRRVDLNYRTGAITRHEYGVANSGSLHRGIYTKALGINPVLVASAPLSLKIYRLDSGLTDDGTVITHYYTTDWLPLHAQEFNGAALLIKHQGTGQAKLLIATDFDTQYSDVARFELLRRVPGSEELFTYTGSFGGRPTGWAKFRVELEPSTTTTDLELIELHLIPLESIVPQRKSDASRER